MGNIAEAVRDDIFEAIDRDKLILPTLPEVALKVKEQAEDENSNTKQLAAVIGNDAAISARLIKVANSPLMRGSQSIEDLHMAISRLGMTYTANLATGLAMEQMFQATSDVIDKRMREVWQRSTEIAGISAVLAKHYTRLKPDQATLAGLVHQIGVLPILTYAEEHENLLSDSLMLEKVIDEIHGEIGNMILSKWDFPEEIRYVPDEYLQFDRQAAKVDYTDIVQVATLQSYIGTDHPYTKLDWSTISSFERLGLDPNVEDAEAEDLSAEMEAAMAALSND